MENSREFMMTMLEYNIWAFDQVWECVGELTDEQFVTELEYSRGSLRNQMVHVISTAERWFERIKGLPAPDYLVNEEFPTKRAVRERWETFCNEARLFLAALDEEKLMQKVSWSLPHRGLKDDSTTAEILMHVFNHATDHRAQMLAEIHYGFKGRTVEQDLIIFLGEEHG